MKRILYIEDNASVQLMVKKHLAKQGDVAAASSLADARRLLRERVFDFLLSDVHLPDGNALDLVFELRQSRTPKEFPIILVSASMDQLLRVKSFKLGVNDCFPMPTPWPVLMGAVERMLAEPYLSAPPVESVATTWIEGAIDTEHWLFCPELNYFVRGADPRQLRTLLAERLRSDLAKGLSLPFVRGTKVSEHLVLLAETSGSGELS